MAEPHDQKEFLELLHTFKSDETKKARRNLSVIAFVLIASSLMGIRIADIKVFGADLSKSSDLPILLVATVLLLYWAIMFMLSYIHDTEVQKERGRRLEGVVKNLLARWAQVEETRIKSSGQRTPHDHGEVKSYVEAYNAQKERTAQAARYGGLVTRLELYVPLGLAYFALLILLAGIVHAL